MHESKGFEARNRLVPPGFLVALSDNPTAPAFIRYWGNRGHWPELARDGSVANDRGCVKTHCFI